MLLTDECESPVGEQQSPEVQDFQEGDRRLAPSLKDKGPPSVVSQIQLHDVETVKDTGQLYLKVKGSDENETVDPIPASPPYEIEVFNQDLSIENSSADVILSENKGLLLFTFF